MSIWPPPSGDVPPIPVSRSGSPDRRSIYDGRRYFEAYPPDQYPYDRDGYGRDRHYPSDYDRERDWAEWDRRRLATRGRSRSPVLDDARRKRRRSYSPHERDRYDPRPRYDDGNLASKDYRGLGRARSPGSYPPRGGGSRFPDPYELDVPANFRAFADWFQATHPDEYLADEGPDGPRDSNGQPNGLRRRYERYRKVMISKQMATMFNYHKASPWFNEKYNPAEPYVNLRLRVRREGWLGRVSNFISELDEGGHDPILVEETPEGDDELPSADNNIQSNGHLNGKKAGGLEPDGFKAKLRDDEVSVLPEGNQVLIRTIPPDIGRVKLERICRIAPGFVHLALGDTMQKRNYYRAGWIKFREDADMTAVIDKLGEEKIEGFKLHVTHSTRPFTARARYTPECASRPERIEKDLVAVKKLVSILEEEASNLARLPEKLPEPRNLKKSQGGELPDDTEEATEGDPEPNVDGEMSVDGPQESKDRGTVAVESRLEKLFGDLQDQYMVNDDHDELALTAKKVSLIQLVIFEAECCFQNEITLDLYLAYLRTAFNCCYYCSAITDHVEELQRKCIQHIRRPLSPGDHGRGKMTRVSPPAWNGDFQAVDDRWEEMIDQKTSLLIERDSVDPRDHGGKSYEEELGKAVEPHVKQEDEGKFRCKSCNKLFKATSFVQKHIVTKHPELVKQLEELTFFNNFALDPHKIQPFSHAPPSSGNGQQAPPEAYGLRQAARPLGVPDGRSRSGSNSYPQYPPQNYYAPTPYGYDYFAPPSRGGYYDYPPAPPPRGYGYYEGPAPPKSRSPPPGRKLSDRLGDFAAGGHGGHAVTATLEPGPGARRGRRASLNVDSMGTPAIGGPPPPDAREDPRAAAGRKVSYYDIDRMAEGDVELTY
ncbi:hypothetical protein BS47DRAFT_1370307 [Hydnum rufescens UP504]|uniref:C2H2-type domain-containing protein n=1 Tax=Hydnum rufescens UP504 TaxID=1448309 RepID=A0A9P6BB47_9AGAM|nr:hypothetical protein BS47DRAFT_1370307 [Hydnum rufescens UP504]